MAQPDWARGDLSHTLNVLLVDPLNLSTIRGELNGVTHAGEFNLDYYSDTRMSATIESYVEGTRDNWDGGSAMRLVHVVSDYTGELWRETLGTFYVMDPPRIREEQGGTVTAYQLSSVLKGIEVGVASYGYTINKGASVLAATKKFVTDSFRSIKTDGTEVDKKAASAVKYEAGSSYLHMIHDSANSCGNYVSVDPNGVVTITRYVAPKSKAPAFETIASDERTLFVGPYEFEDNSVTTPERAIVSARGKVKVADGKYQKAGTRADGTSYKKGDTKYKEVDKTITGIAQVEAGTASSHQRRGYWRDDFRGMSDVNPFTQARADTLAKSYLNNDLIYEANAKHSLMYRPLREGQVELLTVHGETRRWQIASATLKFDTWTWDLDLKGGWK